MVDRPVSVKHRFEPFARSLRFRHILKLSSKLRRMFPGIFQAARWWAMRGRCPDNLCGAQANCRSTTDPEGHLAAKQIPAGCMRGGSGDLDHSGQSSHFNFSPASIAEVAAVSGQEYDPATLAHSARSISRKERALRFVRRNAQMLFAGEYMRISSNVQRQQRSPVRSDWAYVNKPSHCVQRQSCESSSGDAAPPSRLPWPLSSPQAKCRSSLPF